MNRIKLIWPIYCSTLHDIAFVAAHGHLNSTLNDKSVYVLFHPFSVIKCIIMHIKKL